MNTDTKLILRIVTITCALLCIVSQTMSYNLVGNSSVSSYRESSRSELNHGFMPTFDNSSYNLLCTTISNFIVASIAIANSQFIYFQHFVIVSIADKLYMCFIDFHTLY